VNYLLRLAFCASLVGLVFVGANSVRPDVLEEMGLDFWEWPHWQQCYNVQVDRDRELAQGLEQSKNRYQAKNQICRDLIAGRLSLADAARRFEELPDAPARLWERIQASFGCADKHESLCRHVIDWACELMAEQAGEAQALRRRLEGELRANRRS
jgi:hypothetical protein